MSRENRRPKTPFLLRKSKAGNEAVVLKADDFPISLMHEGKSYKVIRTRKGGVQMIAE